MEVMFDFATLPDSNMELYSILVNPKWSFIF